MAHFPWEKLCGKWSKSGNLARKMDKYGCFCEQEGPNMSTSHGRKTEINHFPRPWYMIPSPSPDTWSYIPSQIFPIDTMGGKEAKIGNLARKNSQICPFFEQDCQIWTISHARWTHLAFLPWENNWEMCHICPF